MDTNKDFKIGQIVTFADDANSFVFRPYGIYSKKSHVIIDSIFDKSGLVGVRFAGDSENVRYFKKSDLKPIQVKN